MSDAAEAGGATILWRRQDLPGHDAATLVSLEGGWQLSGVAVFAHDARPCRLEYVVACDGAWRTTSCRVSGHVGATSMRLDLTRADGEWTVDGRPRTELAGCEDVDLGFTPATNLLPIRRLELAVGAGAQVRAAWVRFPELTVEVLEQVYTRRAAQLYLYESAGGAFRRELTVDPVGFVADYPGIWTMEARSGVESASGLT